MIIVWDLDGTLFKDLGKDYDKIPAFTPLWILFKHMAIDNIARIKQDWTFHDRHICVTGRTELPSTLNFFQEVHCRDWEPPDWDKYYAQYFQWKVDKILELKPDLVFEDDQQITRYLTKKGLNVVWVPMYAHMG